MLQALRFVIQGAGAKVDTVIRKNIVSLLLSMLGHDEVWLWGCLSCGGFHRFPNSLGQLLCVLEAGTTGSQEPSFLVLVLLQFTEHLLSTEGVKQVTIILVLCFCFGPGNQTQGLLHV